MELIVKLKAYIIKLLGIDAVLIETVKRLSAITRRQSRIEKELTSAREEMAKLKSDFSILTRSLGNVDLNVIGYLQRDRDVLLVRLETVEGKLRNVA